MEWCFSFSSRVSEEAGRFFTIRSTFAHSRYGSYAISVLSDKEIGGVHRIITLLSTCVSVLVHKNGQTTTYLHNVFVYP